MLLIVALLAMVWNAEQPDLVLAMLIFLAACLALLRFVKRLPGFFVFLLVLAALLNGAGGAFRWFEVYRWFDEAIHTYTGFAGLGAIGYLYSRDRPIRRESLIAWCSGMGLLLGIGWEVIEGFVGDLEAVDTATDLVLDKIGAALGGWFAWHWVGRRPTSIRAEAG